MVLTETPVCEWGKKATRFNLLNVDGQYVSLDQCRGDRGTLIMFICNHCPYVKAIQKDLVNTAHQLLDAHIAVIAIMSNDVQDYPEDSYENMIKEATAWHYPFPYLFDETQEVAKAYGAVCTPDYFGYNADLALHYRGRLNATTPSRPPHDSDKAELLEALLQIAKTGTGPKHQIPSMGCSIKWRS